MNADEWLRQLKSQPLSPTNRYYNRFNKVDEPVDSPVEEPVPEPVEEQVEEPVPEPVHEPPVQQTKVDSVIPPVAEDGPIYIYMNDKFHENLFNRIDELGLKVPNDGLNWLHHDEQMKFTHEEMKDFKKVSIEKLSIQLRTVMFNACTYNIMLADYLHARKIARSDIRKLFIASIAKHRRLVKKIDDDLWNSIVKHLIDFLVGNHVLEANGHINDIPLGDYEKAIKHINERNCSLDYGNVHLHLVRKKVDAKVLTAASADHRQRPAKELKEQLEKMNIVEFYKEWNKLTKDQKKWLCKEHKLKTRKPKNMNEVESLWKNNLIGKATYYRYNSKFNE